jgi:hypothetical protein
MSVNKSNATLTDKQPQVGRQISNLSEIVNELESISMTLTDRVAGVLTPPPVDEVAEKTPPPNLVPLADELYSFVTRLRRVASRLHDTQERIEL